MCWSSAVQRWVSFCVAFIVMLGMGTLYTYSAYSARVMVLLGYTGFDVNLVSSIGDLGLYAGGIPVGFFYDRFGPRLTYTISVVCLATGYGLLWAGVTQRISSNPFFMGLYLVFVGFGSVAGYMAGLLTNTKNFRPEHRGRVVAILVAAYGLSAAIFSQIYHRAVAPHVETFFWILAVALGSLPVFGILLVRPVPVQSSDGGFPTDEPDTPTLNSDENLVTLDQVGTTTSESTEIETKEVTLDLDSTDNYHQTQRPALSPGASKTELLVHHSIGKYGDLRGLTVIQNADFIILFCIAMCCTGIGLTWINILGSVVASYSIVSIPASTYVILLSIANAIGRIVFGSLSDLKMVTLPPVYLMIPCLLMLLVTHFILIFTPNYIVLLIVTLVTGFSYGGSFSVMPVVINKYYGDKNYGSNLGLLLLAVAFSSMAMGFASGAMYDREAELQSITPAPVTIQREILSGVGSKICYGLVCFRYTYVMTSCVAIVGLILTFWILFREINFDRRRALTQTSEDAKDFNEFGL